MSVARVLVILIDPLAVPAVWDAADDDTKLRHGPPSGESPSRLLSRVLSFDRDEAGRRSLVVAVTGRDLTAGLPICADLRHGSPAISNWLGTRGNMPDLVRLAAMAYSEVRYFHTGTDPDADVRDLLDWTLSHQA